MSRDGPPDFDPEKMPQHRGPMAPGWPKEYDPDCCAQPECPQRDYNRACLLALEKLAQAYASFLLVRHATNRLWHCDSSGHTDDCPMDECRFGRERDEDLDGTQNLFGVLIHDLCQVLTALQVDLTAQWMEFTDAELAWIGLRATDSKPDATVYLDSLRDQATGGNELEHHRWFRPPAKRGPGDGPVS